MNLAADKTVNQGELEWEGEETADLCKTTGGRESKKNRIQG